MLRPGSRAELPGWREGDAYLAGGTWLFSEPQRSLRRLIDLDAMGWEPLRVGADGIEIAATCRLASLARAGEPGGAASRFGAAASLFAPCVRALWGSFKIHNTATVGGNLCLALPAGPMPALFAALDATCLVWQASGGMRRIPAARFVNDAGSNALAPGDLLRSVQVPAASLGARSAFGQASLTRFGRSAALVIATLQPGGACRFTVAASVRAPICLDFAGVPGEAALSQALTASLRDDLLHDDVHGAPAWRRAMSVELAHAARRELAG